METSNHSNIRQRFINMSDLELLILIQSTRSEDAIVEFGIRIRPVVLKILYRDYCANLIGISKESLVAEVIADLLLNPPKQREGEPIRFNRTYLTMRVQRTVSGWKIPHQLIAKQTTVSMEQPMLDDKSDEAAPLTVGETLCAPECYEPESVVINQQDEHEAQHISDAIRHAIDCISNQKQREAVRRHLVEEQEYSQISNDLEITQAYARKLYQLGLNSVRAALSP